VEKDRFGVEGIGFGVEGLGFGVLGFGLRKTSTRSEYMESRNQPRTNSTCRETPPLRLRSQIAGLEEAVGRGAPPREREFFIDNLLVRIHFIMLMIRWTGLAPCFFRYSTCNAAKPDQSKT